MASPSWTASIFIRRWNIIEEEEEISQVMDRLTSAPKPTIENYEHTTARWFKSANEEWDSSKFTGLNYAPLSRGKEGG